MENSRACNVKGKVISFVDGLVGDGTECMAEAFQASAELRSNSSQTAMWPVR